MRLIKISKGDAMNKNKTAKDTTYDKCESNSISYAIASMIYRGASRGIKNARVCNSTWYAHNASYTDNDAGEIISRYITLQ